MALKYDGRVFVLKGLINKNVFITKIRDLMLNSPVDVYIQGTNFQFLKEKISHDQRFFFFGFYLRITELPAFGFL
jgi:hypothetical protein